MRNIREIAFHVLSGRASYIVIVNCALIRMCPPQLMLVATPYVEPPTYRTCSLLTLGTWSLAPEDECELHCVDKYLTRCQMHMQMVHGHRHGTSKVQAKQRLYI